MTELVGGGYERLQMQLMVANDQLAEKDKEIEALSCALETAVRKWQDMGDEIERLRFLLKEGLDNGYFDYEMRTAQDWIERVTTAIRGQT